MRSVVMLPMSSIDADPEQPRKAFSDEELELLSGTIADKGIEMPIHVLDMGNNRYTIIEGERRWRAAQMAELMEVPCFIERDLSTKDVIEMQLRSDCTKEKLSSEERDKAIYKYYIMLEDINPEDFGLNPNLYKSDWRLTYISRSIGVSTYVVRMALDKEEFASRNQNFKEKLLSKVNDEKQKSTIKKKINAALDETSRVQKLKYNDSLRKHAIQRFINQDMDSKNLRNLKKAEKEGKLSNKDDIDNALGYVKRGRNAVFVNYMSGVVNLTDKILESLKKSGKEIKLGKDNIKALDQFFSKTIKELKKYE